MATSTLNIARVQTHFEFVTNKKQKEKDHLFRTLTNLDKKIAASKDKLRLSQLRYIRAEAKGMQKDLGEVYVETDESRDGLLYVLISIDTKIVTSTDISQISQLKRMRKQAKQMHEDLGRQYDRYKKKLFRYLQRDANSVLFTEEQINEKDKKFIDLFNVNVDSLTEKEIKTTSIEKKK